MGYSDYDDMLERDRKRGNKGHGHQRRSGMHETRRGDKGSTVGIIAAICILVCLLILLIVLLVSNGDSSEAEPNVEPIEEVIVAEENSQSIAENSIASIEDEQIPVDNDVETPSKIADAHIDEPGVEDVVSEPAVDIKDIPEETIPDMEDTVPIEDVPMESDVPLLDDESSTVGEDAPSDIGIESDLEDIESPSSDDFVEDGEFAPESIIEENPVDEAIVDNELPVDVAEDEVLVASNETLANMDDKNIPDVESPEPVEPEIPSDVENHLDEEIHKEPVSDELIEIPSKDIDIDETSVVEPDVVGVNPVEDIEVPVAEISEIMPAPIAKEVVPPEEKVVEASELVEPIYTLAESSISKYGITIKATSDGIVTISVSSKVNYKDALSLAMKLKNTTNYDVVVKGRDIMIEIGDELDKNSHKAIEKLRSVISSTMRNFE